MSNPNIAFDFSVHVEHLHEDLIELTRVLRYIGLCLTRPPVRLVVSTTTITEGLDSPTYIAQGEESMSMKASVDYSLLDNGLVQFTAVAVDAAGNPPIPTPTYSGAPVWTSANPAVLTVAADPSDATGFTAIGTPVSLGTDVAVNISATLADGTTVINGAADPVDVVAGPIAGFAVADSSK